MPPTPFNDPRIEKELLQAQRARSAGNEGMARVCARRAAGLAVAAYLKRQGIQDPGPSIYDRLDSFLALPGVPARLKSIVGHMLLRVTEEHTLPIEVDLLAEATELATALAAPQAD